MRVVTITILSYQYRIILMKKKHTQKSNVNKNVIVLTLSDSVSIFWQYPAATLACCCISSVCKQNMSQTNIAVWALWIINTDVMHFVLFLVTCWRLLHNYDNHIQPTFCLSSISTLATVFLTFSIRSCSGLFKSRWCFSSFSTSSFLSLAAINSARFSSYSCVKLNTCTLS